MLPALWNTNELHRLPHNYDLAVNILRSLTKKLKEVPDRLCKYNDVIEQQIKSRIIERVDLDVLKNDPKVSFLGHNAIFRENVESTKCRIVYWSNLAEKGVGNLSHNQVSVPGPNMNCSIPTILTLLRFNKFLLVYDLEKAFHQLCLKREDCEKLNFLWYENILEGNDNVVAYQMKRVPFGMRFSPFLLMISLYIILILHVFIISNVENNIRNMLYNLSYMDNLSFSSSSEEEVSRAYEYSHDVFSQYGFNLQQFASNSNTIQGVSQDHSKTLFGMNWNTSNDTYSPKLFSLNTEARTKREILSTVNSVYDPLGILLPTLNRAKLFLHSLQCMKDLTWDRKLDDKQLNCWSKISKQFNRSSVPAVDRFVGDYDSTYDIIAFADASKEIIGCVLYLRDNVTGNISFAFCKNKILNSSLSSKSIPILELCSLSFAAQTAVDFRKELSGAFKPISIDTIHLYSDSMISLNWVTNKVLFESKIERKGPLVNNKLDQIVKLGNECTLNFHHVGGKENPADCVTRCISSDVLKKRYFYSCPDLCFDNFVSVPPTVNDAFSVNIVNSDKHEDSFLPIDKFSSFKKLCNVTHYVYKFIHNVKLRVNARRGYDFFSVNPVNYNESMAKVMNHVQSKYFHDELLYLNSKKKSVKAPSLITQLNLFIDSNGIIRVRGKMHKLNASFSEKFPVLLPRNSPLTASIIHDMHVTMKHCGVYKLLLQFRKEFYITSAFSLVESIVNKCLICKKINGRTVVLNKNCYRDYRVNPNSFPFREIALDHIGPFSVKNGREKHKMYLLIITCFYTRAVNLIICQNIDNESFMLALQSHIFQYGIPSKIVSDNGSPIVSSIGKISDYLNEPDILNFLTERGIEKLSFDPYPPHASFLGGIVESLVKQVKFMIHSSLGKNILSYPHFEFLIKEVNMLINKRPFTCKQLLIDPSIDKEGLVLTPELLIRGYEVPALAVIPHLNIDEDNEDALWCPTEDNIVCRFNKLCNVRRKLMNFYSDKFIQTLFDQSVDKPRSFERKNHIACNVGDLVVIKQKNCKPYSCPSGIIVKGQLQ